jgi:transcriptional regulator with XRE-family HTH domain
MFAAEPEPVSSELPPDESLTRLPRLLREWRMQHSLKAADVAARLGVAPATWGHWETGKRFPSLENLVLVSRFTGIPIQHFFRSHADDHPHRTSASEPDSTEAPVCCTCGAPLYQK